MQRHYYCLLILTFLLLFQPLHAQNLIKLSKDAEISLITGSPGQEVYAVFGHSALRLVDKVYGLDILFNYGVFDFETPNFILKFAQGRLLYQLETSNITQLTYIYKIENRSIKEQVLELTQQQKQELFEALIENAKPENKFYKYDFFFDNCSSRIRDILDKILKNDVQYGSIKLNKSTTYRDMIEPYIHSNTWLDFGITIALGWKADKLINEKQAMFLPDYLSQMLDSAKINTNEVVKPLIKESKMLLSAQPIKPTPNEIVSPDTILWSFLIFILLLSAIEYYRKTHFYFLDISMLGFSGFIGIVYLLMWFGTDHKILNWNWNFLWANPLFAIAIFYLIPKRQTKIVKSFLYFMLIEMTIVLLTKIYFFIFGYDLIPNIPTAIFPLMLALVLRLYLCSKYEKITANH